MEHQCNTVRTLPTYVDTAVGASRAVLHQTGRMTQAHLSPTEELQPIPLFARHIHYTLTWFWPTG